ncbi:galactosylgalactosylxylosylprotein 3-beta-glucuronosyltransferase S-like isoform X2 [Amblyomma americanum]
MPWWRFRCTLRVAVCACLAAALLVSVLLCRFRAPFPPAWSLAGFLDDNGGGPMRRGGPTLYVVTPTYRRATQAPDLVRLSQALLLAQARIFWVIVEDADQPSALVRGIMRRTGLPGVQLVARTPAEYRLHHKGRGVTQRMKALAWLRANATLPGVVYFADDDNAYDHSIFSQMARVQAVGVFPVGLISAFGISSPVVSPEGRVVAFHDAYLPTRRRFPVDMAGFAVNIQLVLAADDLRMPHKQGMLESDFLTSLGVDRDELEPLASNCTETGNTASSLQRYMEPTPQKAEQDHLTGTRFVGSGSCPT